MPVPVWKVDRRRWPLALLYIEGGDGSVAPSTESVLACLEEVSRPRTRRVVVVDTHLAKPDAARRKLLIHWFNTHWASTRTDLVALAVVAPSTFERSTITAVLWFVDLRCPLEVFDTREAAIAWAEKQLEQAGLSAPP